MPPNVLFRMVSAVLFLLLVAGCIPERETLERIDLPITLVPPTPEQLTQWQHTRHTAAEGYVPHFPEKQVALPDGFHPGFVDALDENTAFEIADKTFRKAGIRMVPRHYEINMPGLHVVFTGYDPNRKIGFVFLTKKGQKVDPENAPLGPGVSDGEAFLLDTLQHSGQMNILVINGYGPGFLEYFSPEAEAAVHQAMRTLLQKELDTWLAARKIP